MRPAHVLLALLGVGVAVSACAPARPVYIKPGASRDTVTIDALDCTKVGVVAKRDYLAKRKDQSYETIQAANAVARAAVDRCARSRGYKRIR